MKENRFTSQNYWEEYYKNGNTQVSEIIKICSAYDVLWVKLINSFSGTPLNIVEIGAYPGRYLAYLAAKFNLHPTALDYNTDKSKLEETFELMKVASYDIIQTDFLNYIPVKKYDIVISNGFIEHFEDYNSIVKKHAALLNEGGTLLIMVPNKRYVRKWFDWLCDYDNLKIHNTECMSKQVFNNFAVDNNLSVIDIGYFGSFAYNVHHSLNLVQQLIYHCTRFLFKNVNPFISKNTNKYFSSILYGIYKK